MRRYILFVVVLASLLVSGCGTIGGAIHGTIDGMKRDFDGAKKMIQDKGEYSNPQTDLNGVPKGEKNRVRDILAKCEPKYAPPARRNASGEYASQPEAIRRDAYVSCIQKELLLSFREDSQSRKLFREKCQGKKGKALDDCREGVRVYVVVVKTRDIAARRDAANRPESVVAREIQRVRVK